MNYEDVLTASSYKAIHLKSGRKSDLIIPQMVDPTAPVIFPLVENIVRFAFEKRFTLTLQDVDNRKNLQITSGADTRVPALGDVDEEMMLLQEQEMQKF